VLLLVEAKHHSGWPAAPGPFSRALTVHLLAESGGLPRPLDDDDEIELKPLNECGSMACSIGAQNVASALFCGLGSGVGGCPRALWATGFERNAASSSEADTCAFGEY